MTCHFADRANRYPASRRRPWTVPPLLVILPASAAYGSAQRWDDHRGCEMFQLHRELLALHPSRPAQAPDRDREADVEEGPRTSQSEPQTLAATIYFDQPQPESTLYAGSPTV